MILYDCEAEALSSSIGPSQSYSLMIKWSQGSVQVEISQSSPVETFILGFGKVLSDQPAASRLEHCRGVNFVTLTGSSLTRHIALPDYGVGLDGRVEGVTVRLAEMSYLPADPAE
ncbi:hypothetical protein DY000_02006653 [Brassica cretica]|uniref:Uncharacterized protein n=1 Tax=Brassica cretica TaxID=69181 RepID=A0ABQ7C803_BRACR|nr:hypothetical protein DY000_02006653 [Brassica cretica]